MPPDLPHSDDILATVRASGGRRMIGLFSLWFLGLFLIYVALWSTSEIIWQIVLMVLGGVAIWMADRMRRATAGAIELTASVLRDSDGTVIARVADIEKIDRGVFAFKPSNGFVLRTKPGAAGENAWRPGLWWRVGRRSGIGGMTPGTQTKYMTEVILALMAER